MRSQNSSKQKMNIISVLILVFLLGALGVYALLNKSNTVNEIDNLATSSESSETNISQVSNEPKEADLSNLKIYLSIADNPDDKVIRKTFTGISTLRPEIIVENPPEVWGSCSLKIFRIEGVTSFMADAVTFDVDKNSKRINRNLMLGAYMYRVDLDCGFGDKTYSKVYTLDIKFVNQQPNPTSYSI